MSLIGKVISDIGGDLIKAADGLFTSDDERLKAKNIFQKIINKGEESLRNAKLQQEKERTERHKIDMQSDSWLSKNVRPLSLVFLLFVVSIFALTDGNVGQFKVGADYISLFRDLLILVFGFYFGSRGVEKVAGAITKVMQNKPKKKEKNYDWDDLDGD